MAIRKSLTFLLIIILSFLMMPLRSFGSSIESIHSIVKMQ